MRSGYEYFPSSKHLFVELQCDWSTLQCDWSTLPEDDIEYVTLNGQGINTLTDEFFHKIRNAKHLHVHNTQIIAASIGVMHQLPHLHVLCNLKEYPLSIRKLTNLDHLSIRAAHFGTQAEIITTTRDECKRLVNELADFFEEREADKARILHVIWCLRGYNKDIVKDVVAYMTAIMYAKKFAWRE